ncbi:MAG: hypothetical protein RLY78_3131 [Pseudomonadota bacterium]
MGPADAPTSGPPDLQEADPPRRRRPLSPAWMLRLVGGALLLLLMAHALQRWHSPLLDRLEHAWQDRHLLAHAPREPDPRIVLVEIDERALASQGRWPWPRTRLAELIEHLGGPQQAALIGLDVVLAEAEHAPLAPLWQALTHGPRSLAPDELKRLEPLRQAFEGDVRLAAALRDGPVVAGVHLSAGPGAERIGQLPPGVRLHVPGGSSAGLHAALPDWPGHGGLAPRLAQSAGRGVGVLNGELDEDGMLRRMALLWRSGRQVHPTLALAMLAALDRPLDDPAAPASTASTTTTAATVATPLDAARPERPGLTLTLDAEQQPAALALQGRPAATGRWPVDPQARVWIPYRAADAAFTRISAADVLEGRLPAGSLRGRLVLVGVTAPGLLDQRLTVIAPALPGTLIHAHLLSALLDGRTLSTPAWAPLAQAGLLLLGGLVLLVWLPRVGIVGSCALALAVCGLGVGVHAWAWAQLHRVLPVVDALLLPGLLLLLWLTLSLRALQHARQRLQALFGQYVPPEHVQRMSLHPERHTMSSRQVELSVLFADVRGFTGLAERMPPGELGAMMHLLFSRLTDIIRQHGGTLDKYIGDAVMAFWGAPLDDPRHARHAVDAALAMRAALPALQEELAARGWPRLDLSIGVDSGPVIVGDMGSRHRLAYTVLGDTVNRAARLQGLAGEHRIGLLIGDATRRGLDPDRICLPLGRVQLRGRGAWLPVWHPLPASTDPAAAAAAAVRLDRWQDWLQARDVGDASRAAAVRAVLTVHAEDRPLVAWVESQTARHDDRPTAARPD